jgi:hypothetical protein
MNKVHLLQKVELDFHFHFKQKQDKKFLIRFSSYLSELNFSVVGVALTIGCRTTAEIVVPPLVVFDGGIFFLGDGRISVIIPGRVGCISSSLSFAFEIVTSSSESLFIVGRL